LPMTKDTKPKRYLQGCIFVAVISTIATTASIAALSLVFVIKGEPDRIAEIGDRLIELVTDPVAVSLTIIAYLLLALVCAPFARSLSELRHKDNLCISCGYPRRGLADPRAPCPECGRTPDP